MKRLVLSVLVFFIFSSGETKKTTWVAFGDSITYLNEHQNETDYRLKKGYLTRVAETLPDIEYVNKGYNGWTAQRIAREFDKLTLGQADVYSVFLGTNDWWHSVPLGTLDDYKTNTGNDTFFGSYRTIVDKLRSLNKRARIILI